MPVNVWGDGVRAVLEKAKISEAALASEIGVVRMTINHYVRGTRKPSAESVRKVNRAVATLVRVPEAADYLFALALRDGLLEPEGDADLAGVIALLRSFDSYFIDGAARAIVTAFERASKSDSERAGVFVALAAMRGKRLLRGLEGRPKRDPPIDEVLWLFQQAGAPLEPWLRRDRETNVRRARDVFAQLLEIELAKLPRLSEPERADAGAAILRLFDISSTAIQHAMQGNAIAQAILANETPLRSRSRRKRKEPRHED